MPASALPPIAPPLLGWYDVHARTLPWRAPPGALLPDPYAVWLSEVMLQQTTTAAVAPYYAKFLALWPTVEALAAADQAAVMAAWAGLGYYSRARNLIACAGAVATLGGFPQSEAELRKLPGVGDYTAAAIAAIAFGQRAVVVDANVERVVARLGEIADPLPGARKAIRAATDAITPDARAGDFAQAMMDLGATICTSRSPCCLLCPLAEHCEGRVSGNPERFPIKAAKKPKPQRNGTVWWIEADHAVWLVRRPEKGMLGGMRALPDDGWSARGDGSALAPMAGDWRAGGTVRHSFTHFDLDLKLMLLSCGNLAIPDALHGEWWPLDRIDQAGLPSLFAKAAALALAERDKDG